MRKDRKEDLEKFKTRMAIYFRHLTSGEQDEAVNELIEFLTDFKIPTGF